MKFAILAVLVIVVIAFLVFLWKAAKNWRWYNLLASFITLSLAVAFIFPTAGVLKSRMKWHKYKEDLEKKVETVEREHRLLKYGDASGSASGEGVLQKSQRLSKLAREAGRRWRDMSLQNANPQNQNVVLRAQAPGAGAAAPGTTPDPNAPAPPAASMPEQDLVVHGFGEGPVNGQVLPVFYLGEYRVIASGNNQITLAPTGQLEAQQLQRLSGFRSWSVYEMLPLDGHTQFIAPGSEPQDDNVHGRIDQDLVKRLLQGKVRPETLEKYTRDGGRSENDDPVLSKWVKVVFEGKHSFNVDSKTKGALTDKFFDNSGRSLDGRLQRGEGKESVLFNKDDEIVIKEEAFKELDDANVARKIDTYYVRPLNDYRFVLRKLRLRLIESTLRAKELAAEKVVLDAAVAATSGMQTSNQTDKLKLEQDLDQLQVEVKALREYYASVKSEVKKNRKRMLDLYNSNIQLEQEIKRQQSATLGNVDRPESRRQVLVSKEDAAR